MHMHMLQWVDDVCSLCYSQVCAMNTSQAVMTVLSGDAVVVQATNPGMRSHGQCTSILRPPKEQQQMKKWRVALQLHAVPVAPSRHLRFDHYGPLAILFPVD